MSKTSKLFTMAILAIAITFLVAYILVNDNYPKESPSLVDAVAKLDKETAKELKNLLTYTVFLYDGVLVPIGDFRDEEAVSNPNEGWFGGVSERIYYKDKPKSKKETEDFLEVGEDVYHISNPGSNLYSGRLLRFMSRYLGDLEIKLPVIANEGSPSEQDEEYCGVVYGNIEQCIKKTKRALVATGLSIQYYSEGNKLTRAGYTPIYTKSINVYLKEISDGKIEVIFKLRGEHYIRPSEGVNLEKVVR